MSVAQSFCFRPRVEALDLELDPGQALQRLAGRSGLALLDSAGGEPARWSVLGFDPLLDSAPAPEGPLEILGPLLERLSEGEGDRVPGPFSGGFIGALAYDLGVSGEELKLPPEPFGLPLLAGGLYVDFLVRDEESERWFLVLGERPGDGRAPLEARRRELLALLEGPPTAAAPSRLLSPVQRCTSATEHAARIEAARAQIAAGELYQVNLAHRFLADVEGSPLALYRRLRELNGAPYMGYLELPGAALLSASPELLLHLEGGVARTRPIKGTAPRSADAREDRERAAALLSNEKDLAELGMIVDLERNDLGRVATTGSVRVAGFPSLRSYARVHHLMADVSARPGPDCRALDVLASLFPGGSITGAPKLASMELIARLEGEGRGFFSGSMGSLDLRGQARFNVLIRSMIWRDGPAGRGQVSFRVGGGITWASDAHAEDEETLDKAASLLSALEQSP